MTESDLEASPALAGRAAWTLATQGLSSASNLVLSLAVLVSATGREFAVFSVCLTTYLLVLQLVRNGVGIPVLVTQATAGDHRRAAAGAAGLVVVATAGLGVVLLAVGWWWAEGRSLFWVLAVALVGLGLQDVLRHVAIAWGRSAVAATADGLWLACFLAGVVVGSLVADPSPAAILALWALAGVASTAVMVVALRVVPEPGAGWAWVRGNAALCRQVTSEFVVNSGSYNLLAFGLVVAAGSAELGYFRAAQSLFGPASVLLMGGASLGVPESVRMLGDAARLRRFSVRLSVGLAGVSLACGAALLVLLPVVGPRFFADTWRPVADLIPVLSVFGAAIGAAAGPISVLRACGESGWVLRGRAVAGAMAMVVGLPASFALGAWGMLAGLALGEVVLAVRAWQRVLAGSGLGTDQAGGARVAST